MRQYMNEILEYMLEFSQGILQQCLLSSLTHLTKGSPVWPDEQLQMGLWFTTWHRAFTPHVPGQGSWHLWFRHALSWGQSALTTHSGLQEGGVPTYPTWHEHTACPLISRHILKGPQGEGSQGSLSSFSTTKGNGGMHYSLHATVHKTFPSKIEKEQKY